MKIPDTPATRRALGIDKGKRKAKPKGVKKPSDKSKKYAMLAAYCDAKGWEIPDDEFRFHPVRKWRFDAAFVERRLAIEFHGGVWSGGRHTTGDGFSKDQEKWANAALLGWRIIPVTSGQFAAGALWEYLEYEFAGVKK